MLDADNLPRDGSRRQHIAAEIDTLVCRFLYALLCAAACGDNATVPADAADLRPRETVINLPVALGHQAAHLTIYADAVMLAPAAPVMVSVVVAGVFPCATVIGVADGEVQCRHDQRADVALCSFPYGPRLDPSPVPLRVVFSPCLPPGPAPWIAQAFIAVRELGEP